MTETPSCSALASLEPADSPATTKEVLAETVLAAFPPALRTRASASSREMVDRVPVITTVCPVSGPFDGATTFVIFKYLCNRERNVRLLTSLNHSATDFPIIGPMPSIFERDSSLAEPSA